MGILKQIAEYLYLKKKDPKEHGDDNQDTDDLYDSQSVKYMHGINRLSIFLFLGALIFILVKFLIRR